MDKEEAIKQIESINAVIDSSNTILFSEKRLIISGIIFLFIPLIEYITSYLTFGINILSNPVINIIIQVVFFYLLFFICFHFSKMKNKIVKPSTNPILVKALGIHDTIIITMFASIIVLAIIGRGELIFPFVYIFVGLLFNFFGRFTNKLVTIISWSYIILGLIFMVVSGLGSNYLWIYFMIYLGITYILMGVSIKNSRG
jgi:positive regulator of sigma E activity